MEYTVPTRGTICLRVKKILYETSELQWKPYGCASKDIEEQKEKIK